MSDELDEYELELESQLKNIKRCQKEMNQETCFECDKLLDCKIRKEYVDAVYASMGKGQTGGFEF
ncbi:MAG: Unknown protein [uncultured Campylobacterales bacterium]|uniref:Uncharacterized protein n=1 Tax=uncultured Campylobacterales bacterium TaxID=352960 RepID=A0A6S6S9T4_9BACT|nr:MAG: Unknown protein [uncultured Campylobacterales bacterium]